MNTSDVPPYSRRSQILVLCFLKGHLFALMLVLIMLKNVFAMFDISWWVLMIVNEQKRQMELFQMRGWARAMPKFFVTFP